LRKPLESHADIAHKCVARVGFAGKALLFSKKGKKLCLLTK
jgi:hypothetical protein